MNGSRSTTRTGMQLETESRSCSRCGEIKALELFSPGRPGKFRAYCKPCGAAYTKLWGQANSEKRTQLRQDWAIANPKKMAEYKRIWATRNLVKSRASAASWRRRNKALVNAWTAAYRARKAGSCGSFTLAEWKDLVAKFGGVCVGCLQTLPLTVDHVRPLSKGGTSFIENIQPLCLSCNSRKRDQEIDYRPLFGTRSKGAA